MIRMKSLKGLLVLCLLGVGLAAPAQAQEKAAPKHQYDLPDTFTVGTGWFEYFHHTTYRDDADIRLEHRWGLSLLSRISDSLAVIDPYFQVHPFVGIETTPRANYYIGGGLVLDFLVGPHIVLSPSVAWGFYSQGGGKRLGCPMEFRSTAEAGWRFDNGLRITAYVSHISNAEMTLKNPGAEMLGGYVHIPLTWGD